MPPTERTAGRGTPRQRPVLLVLAGVNGAGKSSVGGHLLARQGLAWFNPDTFARELKAATGCDQRTANIAAWNEGVRRLDQAIARRRNFAIETTLGGHTMPAKIAKAARTHDVLVWFVGLLPKITRLQVYDNSRDAAPGESIPDPLLVAEIVGGKLAWPTSAADLATTPDWARPVLAAAMGL